MRSHREEFHSLQSGTHPHQSLVIDVARDGLSSLDFWLVKPIALDEIVQQEGVSGSTLALTQAVDVERYKYTGVVMTKLSRCVENYWFRAFWTRMCWKVCGLLYATISHDHGQL